MNEIAAPRKPWEIEEHNSTIRPIAQLNPLAPTSTNAGIFKKGLNIIALVTQNQNYSNPYNYGYSYMGPSSYSGGHGFSGGYQRYPYTYDGGGLFGQTDPNSKAGSLLGHLQNLMGAVSAMTQFVDSTVYAGYSSISALTAVAENFHRFRKEYFLRWLDLFKRVLSWLRYLLRLTSDRPSQVITNTEGSMINGKVIAIGLIPVAIGVLASFRNMLGNTAKVLRDYYSNEDGHLSLREGDLVRILAEEDGWCYGQNRLGQHGCFPKDYLST